MSRKYVVKIQIEEGPSVEELAKRRNFVCDVETLQLTDRLRDKVLRNREQVVVTDIRPTGYGFYDFSFYSPHYGNVISVRNYTEHPARSNIATVFARKWVSILLVPVVKRLELSFLLYFSFLSGIIGAMSIQVTRKDEKEANENIIRRFNRRVLQSGVIAEAKVHKRFEKPISKTERRKKAILRDQRKAEKIMQIKLGK